MVDEDSFSSSDDSEVSDSEEDTTGNRRKEEENDSEDLESTYSENDIHNSLKRKQREMEDDENSDDDNGSDDSETRQMKKKRVREEKEKRVRVKIDKLYESIYANQTFKDEEKIVQRELRRVVREYIWPKTKFVKGEGHFVKKITRFGRKQRKKKAAVMYGTSHEQPNLNNKYGTRGYQSVIMKKMNLQNGSDIEKAYWWKTYEGVVKDEIQKLRNNRATDIKRCMVEGKALNI